MPSQPTQPSKSMPTAVTSQTEAGIQHAGLSEEQDSQNQRQMCAYLLETALAASRLPKPIQERLRNQFGGQCFEASALQNAIDDSRTLLAELTAPQAVNGAGGFRHGHAQIGCPTVDATYRSNERRIYARRN